MAGEFELYKDGHGAYRFRLTSGAGELLASSEPYDSKSDAIVAIESVRRNAANAVVVDHT